jgi:hypothetical protein
MLDNSAATCGSLIHREGLLACCCLQAASASDQSLLTNCAVCCIAYAVCTVLTSPSSRFVKKTAVVHCRCYNEQVGQALNYDEVVVYNNEAAMPAYMIVYSLPG